MHNAAFLNCDGGILYLGVVDEKNVSKVGEKICGIEDPRDGDWESFIIDLKSQLIGTKSLFSVAIPENKIVIERVVKEGKNIIVIDCESLDGSEGVFVEPKTIVSQNPKKRPEPIFYIRSGPSCKKISGQQLVSHVNSKKNSI